MHKIEVGQKVWVMRDGVNARNPPYEKHETHVISVGRKWFKVAHYHGEQFSISSLWNDGEGFVSSFRVILDLEREEYEQKVGIKKKEVRGVFSTYSRIEVSDDQYIAIHQILFPNSQEKTSN